MRPFVYISTVILTSIFAEDTMQFDQPNIEMMMQKMQEIQICISKVDLNELSALQKDALQVQKEVEEMCTAGNSDQAEQTAKVFYENMMKLPAMIQIKKCTQGIIPEADMYHKGHICDEKKIDLGLPDTQRINW